LDFALKAFECNLMEKPGRRKRDGEKRNVWRRAEGPGTKGQSGTEEGKGVLNMERAKNRKQKSGFKGGKPNHQRRKWGSGRNES